jgi:hypothetical protein
VQTQGGSAADIALQQPERHFLIAVDFDWDRDGNYANEISGLGPFVERVSVDRSLKGTAPEDLLLIDGAASAELSITVGGEWDGLPLDAIFSPYQGRSPLYGKDLLGVEVKWSIGLMTSSGVVWYPQFVGNVRTIEPDRASHSVVITALDRAELLRQPVLLPPWAIDEYQTVRGQVESQLCESQWVINHCLFSAGVSTSPYRAPTRSENGLADNDVTGPEVWVTGNGSHLPSIGWLDNAQDINFPLTESTGTPMTEPYGAVNPNSPEPATKPKALTAMGTEAGDLLKYWVRNRDQVTERGTQYLGFTLITQGPNSTYYQSASTFEAMNVRIGRNLVITLKIGNGKVWTEHTDENTSTTLASTQVTIPVTTNPVPIIAIWDAYHASGARVFVQAGSNNTGTSWQLAAGVQTPPDTSVYDALAGLVSVRHRVSMQDVFYTSTNFGSSSTPFSYTAWWPQTPKYTAVLDQGLNRLSFMPTRNDDAWDIITQVASAEFGAAFWDESGVFRFWNYPRIQSLRGTSVRTFTLNDVSGLRMVNSLDSVRNIWSVEAQQKIAVATTVLEGETVDQFYTNGSTFAYNRVWLEDVQMPTTAFVPRYQTLGTGTLPMWDDTVPHGYVAEWLIGGTWQEDNTRAGVDIWSYMDDTGTVIIAIHNGWPEPVRLATNDGTPAFRLYGTKLTSPDPLTFTHKDQTSVNKYGPRNYPLSGPWIQDRYNTANMVDQLLPRTVVPIPATDDIEIQGDPRLQLGDAITVEDTDTLGPSIGMQILGINREFSRDDGLVDRLTVETFAPSFVGLWDDPVYGLWDSSFIWS